MKESEPHDANPRGLDPRDVYNKLRAEASRGDPNLVRRIFGPNAARPNEPGQPEANDGFASARQLHQLSDEADEETEPEPVSAAVDKLAADPATAVTEIPPRHRLRTPRLQPFDLANIESAGLAETLKGVIRTGEATFAVVHLNQKNWNQGYLWVRDGEEVRREKVDNFSFEGVDVLVELADERAAHVMGVLANDGQAVQVDRSTGKGSDKTGIHLAVAINEQSEATISNHSNMPMSVVLEAEAEYDGVDPRTLTPPKPDPDSQLDHSQWLVDPEQANAALLTAQRIGEKRKDRSNGRP